MSPGTAAERNAAVSVRKPAATTTGTKASAARIATLTGLRDDRSARASSVGRSVRGMSIPVAVRGVAATLGKPGPCSLNGSCAGCPAAADSADVLNGALTRT